MTPRFVFRLEARDELLEAQDWYERRAAGLGTAFARTVEAAVESLQRAPRQYPVVHRDIRRVLLRRFPYAIFYRADEDEIIVLAVFHLAGDPERWQSRARDG
jgi:plasmid stabilization system protein ParE